MFEPASLKLEPSLHQLLANPLPAAERGARSVTTLPAHAWVVALDAAQVAVVGLALHWFSGFATSIRSQNAVALALLAAVFAALIRHGFRPPGPELLEPVSRAASRAGGAVLVTLFLLAGACTIAVSAPHIPAGFYSWFAIWAGASAAMAAGIRYAAEAMTGPYGERVLVVGPTEAAEPVARALAQRRKWLAGRVAFCSELGLARLRELVSRRTADLVLLAMPGPDAPARAAAVCEYLADQPVRICLALDTSEFVGGHWEGGRSGRLALVDLVDHAQCGWPGVVKRAFDFSVALAVLVLCAPLLALAAIAIRLETPGPVLFKQWRFGLGSRPFQVLKFRTMHAGGSDMTGAARTMRRDPRVTRVGRLLRRSSIDELPQLVNVLRGEMSLVGPRPHPMHMRIGDVYYFDAVREYRWRHFARPGLTGWAQVNGSRGLVDTMEKAKRRVELDLWYVQHWSLLLDLRILLRTALGGFLSMNAD